MWRTLNPKSPHSVNNLRLANELNEFYCHFESRCTKTIFFPPSNLASCQEYLRPNGSIVNKSTRCSSYSRPIGGAWNSPKTEKKRRRRRGEALLHTKTFACGRVWRVEGTVLTPSLPSHQPPDPQHSRTLALIPTIALESLHYNDAELVHFLLFLIILYFYFLYLFFVIPVQLFHLHLSTIPHLCLIIVDIVYMIATFCLLFIVSMHAPYSQDKFLTGVKPFLAINLFLISDSDSESVKCILKALQQSHMMTPTGRHWSVHVKKSTAAI